MNTQRLLDLIKANEEAPDFYLDKWISPCGTHGCLVGNHMLKVYKDQDIFNAHAKCTLGVAAEFYDLTLQEACFLFNSDEGFRRRFGIHYSRYQVNHEHLRDPYDKEAAINRVRKLIYYKLRKAGLMSGGTESYEVARQVGHINVAEEVNESCLMCV